MNTPDSSVPAECRRWNERYGVEGWFFGDAPSPLLVAALASAPVPGRAGRALCLGEGEGRDALYLAGRGFVVTAIDGAEAGLAKLRARARELRLSVSTVCADLAGYEPAPGAYDLATSFYCHLEPEVRRVVIGRTAAGLRADGLLVMEGFDRLQRLRGRTSGGPRDLAVLYEVDELRTELAVWFEDVMVEGGTMEIDYGQHRGAAEVVRAVARSPRSAPCVAGSR